jgi:hypothetical protein
MHDTKSTLLALLGKRPELFPKVTAEKYPHVLDSIVARWNSSESMDSCFTDLMVVDERRQQGFPEEVMKEIFALSNFHDQLFPKPARSPLDFWSRSKEVLEVRQSRGDSNG